MASSQTTNYQLNQWAASDQFLRTEFNADNSKIDAALKALSTQATALDGAKCEVVLGFYTGDDSESRTITLGFYPKAVYLCTQSGLAGVVSGAYSIYGGLAFRDHPLGFVGSSLGTMTLTSTGFQLASSTYQKVNITNWIYYYAALR